MNISLRLDSLSFLGQPPLTSRLSRFELLHCSRLPVAELRHIDPLCGVTHLSCAADEESRSLLTPLSPLLPALEAFDCGEIRRWPGRRHGGGVLRVRPAQN